MRKESRNERSSRSEADARRTQRNGGGTGPGGLSDKRRKQKGNGAGKSETAKGKDLGSTEIYKRFRPETLDEVVGQPDAVKVLRRMFKRKRIPSALLFTGPSGCGKTTLARIVRTRLACEDYSELNVADFRGIDQIREIRSTMGQYPLRGPCKVWLFDECHQLTKDAQNAMLKLLEDTPSDVYFMLATTDPTKLLPTIKSRCTEIKCTALKPSAMSQLLSSICEQIGDEVSEEIIDKLIDVSEGSARKALVILNQIINLDDETDRLNAIQRADSKSATIELCRALANPRARWSEVAAILKTIDDEPEMIRRGILGYFLRILLSGGKTSSRAAGIIEIFRDNVFDSGHAGLAVDCWTVINSRK